MRTVKIHRYIDHLNIIKYKGKKIENKQVFENGVTTEIYTYNGSTFVFNYNQVGKMFEVKRYMDGKLKIIFEE